MVFTSTPSPPPPLTFLAHQHIAHTTNFDKLVELVVERLFKPSLTELEETQCTPQKWL